jgi:hypothetical protein
MALIVAFSPIIASDIFVMLPLAVVYLFAGGPVLALGKQEPTCRDCGLAVPARGLRFLRPCRLVPRERAPAKDAPARAGGAAPTRSPKLGLAPQLERDEHSGVRALPGESRGP